MEAVFQPGRSAAPESRRHGFVGIIDGVTMALGGLAGIALLVMTGIVCFEIVSRYLFNEPTYWVTEISTYLLVGMTFLGLAVAQKGGSHIKVELLANALPERARRDVDVVAQWIGLVFVLFAAWQMAVFNVREFVFDTRDWGLLATPQWIPQTPVTVGLIALALAILADIQRQRPPEGRWAGWLLPALCAALATVLLLLGTTMSPIRGTPFDWGTVAIVGTVLAAALVTSGPAVALALAAVLAGLGAAFWLAHGQPLSHVGILLTVTVLFLLLIGVRIALALGLTGLFGLLFLLPLPQLSLLAERSWSGVNTFTLTAVPMFVLMGALLWRSGVTTDMFDSLVRWFGRVPGGLAHASVGAATVFAAVSGSSLATAATLGSVACPEMIRRGYSTRLTYGVAAAGATLGVLIPPSIPLIIYGTAVGAPVNLLFIAGIIPGLLLAACFMGGVLAWSTLVPGAAPRGDGYSWGAKLAALAGMLPFLSVILVVLGSLYAGIATPSEAAGVGAAFAFVLCALRRKVNAAMLVETAMDTVKVTSFLLIIVVGAAVLSWVFDYLRLPRTLVEMVKSAEVAAWVVMVVITLLYIGLGMFIDSISMMLMTLPVVFPIVKALGLDPIWFGIYLVLMIEIGLITPPVGIVLFVLRGMGGGVALKEIVLGVLPFVAIMLAFVALLYVVPSIATWLPAQLQ